LYSLAILSMLPGDISSVRPVTAEAPRSSAQKCPATRGKNAKQASASGTAMSSARAERRSAARVVNMASPCATSAIAAPAPQAASR
jgi:hypothetical protein